MKCGQEIRETKRKVNVKVALMTVRNFLNCSENIYRALSTKIMEMKALLFTETMD